VLVGLFSAVRLSNWSNHLLLSVFHSPPAVLAQKARDQIEGFGYAGSPMDQAYGFIYADEYQEYMEVRHQVAEFKDQIARQRPSVIHFWYRQSPQYLETLNADAVVSPPIFAGMAGMELDSRGRLISFRRSLHFLRAPNQSGRRPIGVSCSRLPSCHKANSTPSNRVGILP
jgi:hypothetical protein